MSVTEIAQSHQRDRAQLAGAAEAAATQAWQRLDPANIVSSWAGLAPGLTTMLTAAQYQAASTADAYVDQALTEQGATARIAGRIDPARLAGVASDGRPLASLIFQPAITTVTALRAGVELDRALAGGLASLRMIASTQVADAGRVADGAAITARPGVAGYVRIAVGRTCGRCTILAGKFYRWSAGFARHPKCDCQHVPSASARALATRSPRQIFDSMTSAEQDQAFTRAGAEAIRAGADPAQVVNARRGMCVAGGEQLTRTGGMRSRLMPEEIYRRAAGSRDEAIRLLRLHGYLVGQPASRLTA